MRGSFSFQSCLSCMRRFGCQSCLRCQNLGPLLPANAQITQHRCHQLFSLARSGTAPNSDQFHLKTAQKLFQLPLGMLHMRYPALRMQGCILKWLARLVDHRHAKSMAECRVNTQYLATAHGRRHQPHPQVALLHHSRLLFRARRQIATNITLDNRYQNLFQRHTSHFVQKGSMRVVGQQFRPFQTVKSRGDRKRRRMPRRSRYRRRHHCGGRFAPQSQRNLCSLGAHRLAGGHFRGQHCLGIHHRCGFRFSCRCHHFFCNRCDLCHLRFNHFGGRDSHRDLLLFRNERATSLAAIRRHNRFFGTRQWHAGK